MKKIQHTAFDQLPIVDTSPFFSDDKEQHLVTAQQLNQATREAGFSYVRGHNISQTLIGELKQVVKLSFAQGIQSKMNDYIGQSNNHTGYVPQGEEIYYSESNTNNTIDLKEAYDIGPESPSLMASVVDTASTQWLADNHHFKGVVEERYAFPFFASLEYQTVAASIPAFVKSIAESDSQPPICSDHLFSQTVQTFAYLQKREKAGEIKLPESSLPTIAYSQAAAKGH